MFNSMAGMLNKRAKAAACTSRVTACPSASAGVAQTQVKAALENLNNEHLNQQFTEYWYSP